MSARPRKVGLLMLALVAMTGATSSAHQEPDPPVAAGAQASPAVWPGAEWAVSTFADRGLDGGALEAVAEDAAAGRYGYTDRILVVHGGYAVLDRAFQQDYREASQGRDMTTHQYNYYHPDFHPFHQGSEVHTLQSVTKSVTSALIGIAISRGEIPSTNSTVLPFFIDYDTSAADSRKRRIRLEDLLTMRAGIEWHETDVSYEDERNTTIALEASEDWIQFTLDQPMEAAPGELWVYNSGASHLLSGIIHEATGRHVDDYARELLFEPIGIRRFHWKKTPKGFGDTEGGLYLRSEDLARFGYLILNDGVWDGRRIIPEDWVATSTARIVGDLAPRGSSGRGYGYQWWRLDRPEADVIAGLGFGGQYLLIIPERGLVGVVNSWNVFGGARSILDPFLDALLASSPDA